MNTSSRVASPQNGLELYATNLCSRGLALKRFSVKLEDLRDHFGLLATPATFGCDTETVQELAGFRDAPLVVLRILRVQQAQICLDLVIELQFRERREKIGVRRWVGDG